MLWFYRNGTIDQGVSVKTLGIMVEIGRMICRSSVLSNIIIALMALTGSSSNV